MFKVQRSPWSGDFRGCCAAATWEGELSIKYYYKKLDLNRKKEKDESRQRSANKSDSGIKTSVLKLTY